MTKDRRLGKGLAALLGTPLDADDVVDATSRPVNANVRSTPSTSRLPAEKSAANSGNRVVQLSDDTITPIAISSSQMAAAELSRFDLQNTAGSLLELPVNQIDANPFQPRRRFSEEEIAALAESIREHQQLQPVLVRRVGGRYQLISGERRLRATVHAGFSTIRAELREADDRLVAELAIVENLQRKDLDAIEKALSFRRYIDEHKCTQDDLAKRLKIDRSTIANLMRLLELPQHIQEMIQSEKLTAGHARALLPLSEEQQQLEYAQRILSEAWSVRETERQVTAQLDAEDGKAAPVAIAGKIGSRKRNSPQVAVLEQQLRLALGTKTEIRQSASGRGKIVISFTNNDEFERLMALICPATVLQSVG